MSFRPIQRTRLAHQVAEALREAIVGGSYTPGENLPAERRLAESFGVNRSSIREAIQRLEVWGLVKARQGGGTQVVDFLAGAGFQLLPWLLAPGGTLDPKLLVDLLELRVELLGWTAGVAARRTTAEGQRALEASLEALEAAHTVAARQEADFAFFEVMVGLTGNRVLRLLANAIRAVYLENAELFSLLYTTLDCAPHRRAVRAIAEGDAEGARSAMEDYGRVALGLAGGAHAV